MRPPGALQPSPLLTRLVRVVSSRKWFVSAALAALLGLGLGLELALTASSAGATTAPNTTDEPSSIAGRVVDSAGEPVVGLKATLNTAAVDGEVERFLRPAFTDSDGRFRFDDIGADCYIVIFEAPDGASFDAAAATTERYSCLDPGQSDLALDVALTAGRPGEPFSVNLLHIGDHHSHLLARTITVELAGEQTEIEVGGMARVATVMSERSEALGPESTVTINSGGSLGGSIFHTVFGGAADAAVLNTICFDLLGIGADDVGQSDASLQPFLDFLADGDCSSAIVGRPEASTAGGTASTDLTPVYAKQVGGGVVGFVTVGQASEIEFTSEPLGESDLARTQAEIDQLRAVGVDNIVLLSTIGLDADLQLVARLSGVDGLIGGGSHSLLGDFTQLGLDVSGRYPLQVENLDGEPVCIGHAWQYALVVGELRLSFDGQGALESCDGEAHLLLSTIAKHPDVNETIAGYVNALGELAQEPLATVTEKLCYTSIPSRSVGLLCADDVVGDGVRRPSDIQLLIARALKREADIGIVNSGIVDQGLGVGALQIGDAYSNFANSLNSNINSDNSVYLLRMTGAELATTLEEAVAAAVRDGGSSSSYPYAAGLRWAYDHRAAPGGRVGALKLESPEGQTEPIDPKRIYTVATTGFLAFGGDDYRTMAAATADDRALRTDVEYSQALIDYIRQDLAGHISH